MLRNMTSSDLENLLLIEQSVHVAPWSRDTFQTCFESGYLGWVIEDEKYRLTAFIIASFRADECHILNLCVAREYQRKGWGHQLMEHALSYARQHGARIRHAP